MRLYKPTTLQGSITNYAIIKESVESLDQLPSKMRGLYHYFNEKLTDIKSIIIGPSLPSLDILPEVSELFALDKKLRLEPRREYVFIDKFMGQLKENKAN
jgi:chromosome partitioning protein